MEKRQAETAPQNKNKLLGAVLAVLLVVGIFFSGLEIGRHLPAGSSLQAGLSGFLSPAADMDEEADLTQFWRVWNILNDRFVTTEEKPGNEDRVRGAIAGLVESFGDPYTVYMPPTKAAEFAADIAGNFSGVGMEVGLRDDLITVIAPLPDTPAAKAGIQTGDVITKIDDTSTEGMAVDEAVRLIRGDKGTEVRITLYREGASALEEKTIVRDTINIPTLVTEEKGDVFVIRLYSFNALSEAKTREAVQQFKNKGYKKLVLDLRGNPGGFLESAVAIAGYFLPPGKVVVRESFGEGKEEQVHRTTGQQLVEVDPDNFVVLVDGGSASASEILAGALSEHQVATTIGDKTFGKGSVQELVNLPDDSAVKVTIARWLTPEGVSFSEGGLEPDVKVLRTAEDAVDGKDPQQEAALNWLRGDHSVGEKVGFDF